MATDVKSAQKEFAALVGEDHLSDDPATCAACAVDGSVPWLVLYPTTAEEVAAALKLAADRGLAVIPFRNRTKLDIGNPPRQYDVGLCLKGMNNVWHFEPADLTITVEAGMKLGDFQYLANRHQLWLPLDPAGGASASLGGILATNASGPLRHAYGSPRDMVLGMKIATAGGTLIKTGGRVVKNVAGYDLSKLLIGSYGTLGVIVEASLKLSPLPVQRASYVLRAGNLGIARDLRRRILASPLTLIRQVLFDEEAMRTLRAGTPLASEPRGPEMWMEAAGSERVLERTGAVLEKLGKEVGASAEVYRAEETASVWNRAADFRRWMGEAHPGAVALRVHLPLSQSEEFLSRAEQEAENAKARMATMSLAGVGIVQGAILDSDTSGERETLVRRLRQSAEEFSGSLVLEQCPLEWKARLDVWGEPQDDFDVMKKVKATWDPKGTLAPGRMIGRM